MTVTSESHSPTEVDETEKDIVGGEYVPPPLPPPAKAATATIPAAAGPKLATSEEGGTLEAKTVTSNAL